MATVNFIGLGKKRQKKWIHEKMILKRFLFRVSLMGNTITLSYLAYKHGYLTNILELIKKVAPIVESLIEKLPL